MSNFFCVCRYVFDSCKYQGVQLLYGKSIFSLGRNCKTAFQSNYATFHSHWQWMWVSVASHPLQHLVLWVFQISTIPIDIWESYFTLELALLAYAHIFLFCFMFTLCLKLDCHLHRQIYNNDSSRLKPTGF